jgi:thiamine biosynthesis lipoprotein
MTEVHQFNHGAMATHFQVRIVHEEKTYAAQAARAAFDLLDTLESRLSRFRINSDIARIAHLAAGEKMRLSEPAFACLEIAKRMEQATHRAFCATPGALRTGPSFPQWDLLPDEHSVLCVSGRLQFDLGAIGKGFALDRIAELLRQWDCPSFLLVAGGSSILAGDPPPILLGGPAAWVRTMRRSDSF